MGESSGHLELSEYNRMCNNFDGCPPSLNLKKELKNGLFVQKFIQKYNNIVSGCHDISDGGIILALAELAIRNKKGLRINQRRASKILKNGFCEDQSRYLLIIKSDEEIIRYAKIKKIKIKKIADVVGENFTVTNRFDIPIKKLVSYNKNGLKSL